MKLQAILLGIIIMFGVSVANAQTDNDAKDLYYGERPRTNRQAKPPKPKPKPQTNRRSSNRRSGTTRVRRNTTRRSGGRVVRRRSGRRTSGVSPTATGLPGTKVTIELMRKGKLSFVKPNYRFRSGDKIRLRMKTNFEGYVNVLNLGSSGNVNLLYPVQGKDNYVTRTSDYQIPQGNGWIVFDDRPGTEIISVIMSESKLGNFAELDRNSRYFQKDRTSKDLFVQTTNRNENDGFETYVVFRQQEEGENVGFTLKLRHSK